MVNDIFGVAMGMRKQILQNLKTHRVGDGFHHLQQALLLGLFQGCSISCWMDHLICQLSVIHRCLPMKHIRLSR